MIIRPYKNIRQKLGGAGYKSYGGNPQAYRKFIARYPEDRWSQFHIIIALNEATASIHIDYPAYGKTKSGLRHYTIQKSAKIREEASKFGEIC